jgi:hypothetical protein
LAAKRKVEVLPPGKPLMNSHHVSRLDTVGAIRREQAKIYRMAAKGQISSAEAARLIFCLREVRSSVESEPPIQSQGVGSIINILPIAAGTHFSKEACEHLARTGQLPTDAVFTLIEEPTPESVPALERLEAEVVPLHRSDRVERFPEGAPAADVDCLIDDCITGLNKIEDEAPETPPDAAA